MSLFIKPEGDFIGGEFDYYGQRYATYGSKIEIFSITDETSKYIATLNTDNMQVTSLSWSSPQNGEYIAACLSSSLKIYKEVSANAWEAVFQDQDFQGRLTSVSWAPEHLGLALLVSCEDGKVSIYTLNCTNEWKPVTFKAHNNKIFSASWMYDAKIFTFISHSNTIKVWKFDRNEIEPIYEINERAIDAKACHYNQYIAVCGSGGVFIYDTCQNYNRFKVEASGGGYLQWSTLGTILIVSGHEAVQVVRRVPSDQVLWKVVQRIGEDGKIELVS